MSPSGPWRDPRRWAFHLLTVLAVVVCVLAAWWQWDRAHRTEADAVPDAPAVPLSELDPAASFAGMRVSVTGHWDATHDLLVAPRDRDGQPGAWVLTPMIPDGGPAVAVVRGWIPQGANPPAPEEARASVVGVLVADARAPQAAVSGEPPALASVDTGALSRWAGYPIRSGWIALQRSDPAGRGQPLPLAVTELPGAEVGLNWRNAAYAVQWVVFAGFVLFFWNRFRREYAEQEAHR